MFDWRGHLTTEEGGGGGGEKEASLKAPFEKKGFRRPTPTQDGTFPLYLKEGLTSTIMALRLDTHTYAQCWQCIKKVSEVLCHEGRKVL